MSQFWLGVGASLLAAFLFWLASEYLAPALWKRFKHENGSVSGRWATYDALADSATRAGWATIKQVGGRVTIDVRRERKRDGSDLPEPRQFVYRGRFRAGNLSAVFTDRRADHAIGAIVLHHRPGAERLVGKTMYYDDEGTGGVVSHDFVLRRAH